MKHETLMRKTIATSKACLRALRGNQLKKELVNQRPAYVGMQEQGAEKWWHLSGGERQGRGYTASSGDRMECRGKERDELIGTWEKM